MTDIGSYYKGKVELAENSKYIMLEKQDFDQCNFHNLWDQCLDKNRYGTRIKFPVRVHLNLSLSPKLTAVENGILVNPTRMPLERVTIDFVRQPFSILNF